MAIIESDKIDIEIQEQTDPDAGCKYMVLVSFEGPDKSKEIAKVLLTNSKPHIRTTVDTGNTVIDKSKLADPEPEVKIFKSYNGQNN